MSVGQNNTKKKSMIIMPLSINKRVISIKINYETKRRNGKKTQVNIKVSNFKYHQRVKNH